MSQCRSAQPAGQSENIAIPTNFYLRWAKKAPMTTTEWALFWAEFRALEGEIEKWYDVLTKRADELQELSGQGREIVENHERTHPDEFVQFRKSLENLEVLLKEAKMIATPANGTLHND